MIAIAGGGITGLTVAHTLHHLAAPNGAPLRFTLIDASDRLGGKLVTHYQDGFVIEGGPDAFLASKPWGIVLCRSLGLTDRMILTDAAERRAFEKRDGRLHLLPPSITPPMVTFRRGMQELIDALADAINFDGDTRHCLMGRAVRRVRASINGPHRYDLILDDDTVLNVSAVVLTTPAPTTADILQDLDSEVSGSLRAMPYDSITGITFGYRRDDVAHALDGHGYLIPPGQGTPITGSTWASSKFPERAPDDHVLLRGFVRDTSGWCDPTDHEALVALLRNEFQDTLGIVADPVFTHVQPWLHGLPKYAPDHAKTLQYIEARLARHPGIVLAGGAYHGVGVPDCVRDGEHAAVRAMTMEPPSDSLIHADSDPHTV